MSLPCILKPAAQALGALCAVSCLLAVTPAHAALDMFLKINTLNGESTDRDFGAIGASDVLAWSWGMSNGSLGPGGQANFQDLSLTKYLDSATPGEMLAIAKGTVFTRARLSVRRAGSTDVFLTLTFDDVKISSLSTGGSAGEERFTANITLAPLSRMALSYTPEGATRAQTAVWILENGAFQSFRGNPKALLGLAAAGAGQPPAPSLPISQPVPEPQTWALFGLGLAGLAWVQRRRPGRSVRASASA